MRKAITPKQQRRQRHGRINAALTIALGLLLLLTSCWITIGQAISALHDLGI